MKPDSGLKSLFVGRYCATMIGVFAFYLRAKGVDITEADQKTILDMFNGVIAQYGVLAAAGMTLLSKIREILRGKKGKLSS